MGHLAVGEISWLFFFGGNGAEITLLNFSPTAAPLLLGSPAGSTQPRSQHWLKTEVVWSDTIRSTCLSKYCLWYATEASSILSSLLLHAIQMFFITHILRIRWSGLKLLSLCSFLFRYSFNSEYWEFIELCGYYAKRFVQSKQNNVVFFKYLSILRNKSVGPYTLTKKYMYSHSVANAVRADLWQ